MPRKYVEIVNVHVPFSDKEQKARWKAKLKAVGESQFRSNGMALP